MQQHSFIVAADGINSKSRSFLHSTFEDAAAAALDENSQDSDLLFDRVGLFGAPFYSGYTYYRGILTFPLVEENSLEFPSFPKTDSCEFWGKRKRFGIVEMKETMRENGVVERNVFWYAAIKGECPSKESWSGTRKTFAQMSGYLPYLWCHFHW